MLLWCLVKMICHPEGFGFGFIFIFWSLVFLALSEPFLVLIFCGDWTHHSNVFMFLLAAATTRSHQQGQQRPANLSRQEFLERKVTVHISSWSPAPTSIYCLADFYGCCRFKRSAGLVASGVAKNLNKTARYIKENIQDMLYPDRRPPK